MRGIRIWHLAALVLTVPLLAANVPSGCTGGLNSNFVASVMGQNAAGAASATMSGYVVLGFYNYTGQPGHVTFSVSSQGGTATGYNVGLPADTPTTYLWACDQYLWELTLAGGDIFVTNPTTGQTQTVPIAYNGGVLGGKQLGDPLECGTLIKANVRYVGTAVRIDVELIK